MSEKVNDVNKKGGWARFMEWYGSYQGKRVVGMVYRGSAFYDRLF